MNRIRITDQVSLSLALGYDRLVAARTDSWKARAACKRSNGGGRRRMELVFIGRGRGLSAGTGGEGRGGEGETTGRRDQTNED
jgi:hypothetical protein